MTTAHPPLHEAGRLAGFAYEVGRLRFVLRDFYHEGAYAAPNVAEHIYRVSMLAWLIAETEGANVEAVLKMALIHDLPEVRTMDFGVIAAQYSHVQEEKAAHDILADIFPQALKDWEAYEARDTFEAKIVKDADLLDVVLECKEAKCRGLDYPSFWDEELLMFPERLHTQTAKTLFDEIWASHPMEWTRGLYAKRKACIAQNISPKFKVA